MKLLNPVYKRIKIPEPHCPDCGQHLYQTGSLANPWECKCGIWKYKPNWEKIGPNEYEVK